MNDFTPSLILQLRQGNPSAALLLEQLYRRPLLRFCRGYVGTEAEDAVQEVFARVLGAEVVPQNFRPWIYSIARNLCLNLRRNQQIRQCGPLASDLDLVRSVTGPLSGLIRQERFAEVHQWVQDLPQELRETLRLRYTEGLSRGEVAEVLETSTERVKMQLFKGMELLRRKVEITGAD